MWMMISQGESLNRPIALCFLLFFARTLRMRNSARWQNTCFGYVRRFLLIVIHSDWQNVVFHLGWLWVPILSNYDGFCWGTWFPVSVRLWCIKGRPSRGGSLPRCKSGIFQVQSSPRRRISRLVTVSSWAAKGIALLGWSWSTHSPRLWQRYATYTNIYGAVCKIWLPKKLARSFSNKCWDMFPALATWTVCSAAVSCHRWRVTGNGGSGQQLCTVLYAPFRECSAVFSAL